jgi:hypothetical protein
MSVDVEIYMNNLIKFFRENPKDLLNLIPKNKEDEFYIKIKEVASQNYEKGEEAALTQPQLINICRVLNGQVIEKKVEENIEELDKRIFIKYKNGYICLN